jgi:DNA polymerase-1
VRKERKSYVQLARELKARKKSERVASPAENKSTGPVVVPERNGNGLVHAANIVSLLPVEASTQRPWDEKPEYKDAQKCALIGEKQSLQDLVMALEKFSEVAIDLETYPQDECNSALDPRRGQVRLISAAAEGNVGGVVDVSKVNPGPLLEALRGKTLIAHNAKFELSFLKSQFGYEHDGPVVDTQVLDALIYYAAGPRREFAGWKGFPKNEEVRHRSLKDVAADYLGAELDKEEQTSDFGREEITEAQISYSLRDAEILVPLKEAMMARVRELGLERVAELESRVTPAIAYCENNGFALDTEGWRDQALRAIEEAERIKAECDALAPPVPEGEGREGWNWGSTKQLGEALELLGAALPKHPTGNYKTDDATLKGIESPKAATELARAVLRYREAKKSASTWGLGWFDPPKKKPRGKRFDKSHQLVVGGRVYSSFHQVVKTGRMSSSRPNLQNIPSELRKYFVAPRGRKLLIADYKQIELVTAAVVSGEEKLLEAFRRGEDVHALTARGILEADLSRGGRPVGEDEVKSFRPKAKMVSFGILYGISARGLAWRISNAFEVHTTKETAQGMIDRFLETYPTLKEWYLTERGKADSGDDQTRTLAGRLRLLNVERRFGGWRSQYQLRLNTPIQGSAGDGFKHAAALLWERSREWSGDPRIVNLVHDEIVVEVDSENVEAAKGWLERCMLDGMAEVLGPEAPVSVEISVAENWGAK